MVTWNVSFSEFVKPWFCETIQFVFLLRKRRERGLNLSVTEMFHFACRLECVTAWGWHGNNTNSCKLPITFEFHWNAIRHKDEMENCKFTWVELLRFMCAPSESTNFLKKAEKGHYQLCVCNLLIKDAFDTKAAISTFTKVKQSLININNEIPDISQKKDSSREGSEVSATRHS